MKIPFYPNTKDDFHCVQAVLKMALKYYFPDEKWSFKKLDDVTFHKRGKFTWKNAMMLFLAEKGVEVVYITDFNFRKFADKGKPFLKINWPEKVFEVQDKYSDLNKEQKLTAKILKEKRIKLVTRPALLGDIRKLLKDGYLLMANINPSVLDGKDDYWSHFVLITDAKKDYILFHDPGLPPISERRAHISLFMKAMGFPKRRDATIMAVKKIN